MNMKLLSVVTPLSIYRGCSTWKTFWEKKFTPVNMKNCCCHNVMKHRETNYGNRYITLDIYLNFGSLDKIRIKYSEPKDHFGRSGKELITAMGLKNSIRLKKNKKSRYSITKVGLKDISKIIKGFEDLPN